MLITVGGNETTPEEKWEQLMNPKTVEDYGLSITELELETFDEGRAIVAEIRAITENDKRQTELMRMLGAKAGDTVERIRYGGLTATALPSKTSFSRGPSEPSVASDS